LYFYYNTKKMLVKSGNTKFYCEKSLIIVQ